MVTSLITQMWLPLKPPGTAVFCWQLQKLTIQLLASISNECVCLVAQSCPILCNPMDYSPPGSSVHGIFQSRILEYIAISSSREPSWPSDWICVSPANTQVRKSFHYDNTCILSNVPACIFLPLLWGNQIQSLKKKKFLNFCSYFFSIQSCHGDGYFKLFFYLSSHLPYHH